MPTESRMASSHDLVYQVPPRNWEDGFPIGNGQFGAMVWQPEAPDRVVFGITKLDVWDYRVREDPVVPFDRYRELLRVDPRRAVQEVMEEPAYDVPYPCPKPCGQLAIGVDEVWLPLSATMYRQSQRLRLHEAAVEVEYEVSTKAVRVTGLIDPDANVLAIQIENTWTHGQFGHAHRQPITLSREIDETLGMPEVGTRGRVLFIRYRFPDGFEYVIAALVSGVPTGPAVILPDRVCTAALLPRPEIGPVYTIYLTVVTSRDSAEPLVLAIDNLHRAEGNGFEAVRERHRKWWANFWERSGVELQDRFLEGLWYYELYQLASTCGGDTAPGLFGLWNMTKSPPWHGDYHGDYNVSMAHWYLFSSNHLELGEPYFRTFSAMLPRVKHQTRELYQIDGAKYPIATSPGGAVEMTRRNYRMMQVSSAYCAIPFYWHYRYTRDFPFLRDVAFPILEEASKFYLALVEKGPDGCLRLGPSWAPEQGPLPAYNANNDLGLVRPLWDAYLEACRALGMDTPYVQPVAEALAGFPEYPAANGRFLDSATAPEDLLMAHTGLFAMVYPGGDVDADHPLAEVAARTVDTFYQRGLRRSFVGRESLSDIQGWVTQALASARLRRPDRLDHYLMDIGISEYLKPNGMFTIISNGLFRDLGAKRAAYDLADEPREPRAQNVLVVAGNTRRGRDQQFQFLEGPSAFLCIVNEMLLQSHKGILRIFPCVPERIADCAFVDLRGEGAFLVSARCRRGQTERVEIMSLAGGVCTVRLFRHDEVDPVRVVGPAGEIRSERPAPDTWRFATVPSGRYVLAIAGADEPVTLQPSSEPAGVTSFVDSYGERLYYGKPERYP